MSTTRITQRDLEARVAYLNRITGQALEPYTKNESGEYVTNIGNYHLSYAYGGVELQQMMSNGGGVRNISPDGHDTKRKLYDFINAYISGMAVKV